MIKNIFTLIVGLVLFLTNGSAQYYLEDMEASNPATTTFDNTQYVSSSNGLTWKLNQCRYSTKGGHNIDGKSVLLKAGEGNVESPVISGGVRKISFQQFRGWSDPDVRTFSLIVSDIDNHQQFTYPFTREEGASTVEEFTVSNLSISGNFSLKIVNTSTSVVIAIDNIKWLPAETYYEGVENISDVNTGYHNAAYVGEDGLTWNYEKGRSAIAANVTPISGNNGLMLNTGWGNILSGVLVDGISELHFSARQAWVSKDNDRNLKVRIWDETMTTKLFEQDLIYKGVVNTGTIQTQKFDLTGLDIKGKCRIRILNVTSTGGSEILIDDIIWKSNPNSTAIADVLDEVQKAKIYMKDQYIVVEQDGYEDGQVSVYSLAGELVLKTKICMGGNNIPFTEKGLFIVNLQNGKNNQSVKIVAK